MLQGLLLNHKMFKMLICIILGQIPHSARPPSLNFTGARLTFVTKLQMNEYEGRKKNLQEELRHFKAHAGSIETLEVMAQSGDTLKYMKQMKAIKDKIKAGTLSMFLLHIYCMYMLTSFYIHMLSLSSRTFSQIFLLMSMLVLASIPICVW